LGKSEIVLLGTGSLHEGAKEVAWKTPGGPGRW